MTANVKVAGFNDKQPAWWGLGIQPENAYQWADVSTGFEAAGMMYKLYLTPCKTEFKGIEIEFTDRRVVTREPSLRDDQPTLLDVVSDNFVLLQNQEIAERFDPLCKLYKLATFGVLDEGRRVWCAFETDEFDIKGDPFKGFLVAYGHQAGSGSFSVFYTNVRVVCQNTLMMALDKSFDLMKFAHKGQVKDLVEMRAWAEVEVAASRQNVIKQWEMLVNTKVNEIQVAQIIEAAFPEPKKGKAIRMVEAAPDLLQKSLAQSLFDEAQAKLDRGMVSVENNRVAVGNKLNIFNSEFPQFAGTAYAVVNAVTEHADWPENARKDTPQATLFGYRNGWKQKAWAEAMKIAKASNN